MSTRTFNVSMAALLAGLMIVAANTGAIAGNDPSLDTGFAAPAASVTLAAE